MKHFDAMTEKQNASGPSEYHEDPIEGTQPGKQSLGQGWEIPGNWYPRNKLKTTWSQGL